MELIINPIELGYEKLTHNELETIASLKGCGGWSYDPDTNVLSLYAPTIDIELTKELIDSKTKEIEKQKTLDNTQRRINNLCTSLTNRIKEFLTYKNVTPDQEERYKIKREAALKDDISAFTLEAQLLGKDPAELMAYVKALSLEWEQAANSALLKIDAFRVKLNSILKEDITYTNFILEYLESNVSTLEPDVDVIELFKTLEVKYQEYLEEQAKLLLKEEEEVVELETLSPENQNLLNTLSVADTIDQEDLVYEEPINQG